MTEPIPGLAGTWALTVATPIGKLPVTVELRYAAGALHGTASSRSETVSLRELVAIAEPGGVRLTWLQTVTRPMRLNLRFDVLAAADAITGVSQAGRLPRSTITGTHVPAG